MKLMRMIIIACEILLVVLLTFGIISKLLGYDISPKKHENNLVNIDKELGEKLLSFRI